VKQVEVRLSSLRDGKPHEYAIRFFFGGLCTVAAGLVANRYGPGIGGLFLAFPAIFPASASLIESHEKERKKKVGADGTNRGRMAASLDSAGASLGSVGLLGFGLALWWLLKNFNSYLAVLGATLTWVSISYTLWTVRGSGACRRRRR
jgi:hypothetical protein